MGVMMAMATKKCCRLQTTTVRDGDDDVSDLLQ